MDKITYRQSKKRSDKIMVLLGNRIAGTILETNGKFVYRPIGPGSFESEKFDALDELKKSLEGDDES